MMSKKQWFVLLCVFVTYLLVGAAIFYTIEAKEEQARRDEEIHDVQTIEAMLKKHCNVSIPDLLYKKLTEYCNKPIGPSMSTEEIPMKWDFYHSLFFVITVVSTIGYGNLAPTTTATRLFMILYGLIGIPMNGIVMVTLGDYFGKSFKKLYNRWKIRSVRVKAPEATTRLGLIVQIFVYAIPGLAFIIIIPSVIMMKMEGWSADVALYYSFVTLTTIGFGDYVAGVENPNAIDNYYHLIYKIFLLVWVIVGLGYIVMVIGFITNGMTHKKIKQLERILATNIKKTPQRIRSELRTLLNEFLLMKVKPVYKKEFNYIPTEIHETQSCPNLTIYKPNDSPTVRKRAFSEAARTFILHRIQSDTDLHLIDKDKTFETSHALKEQNDLLLKVVDALSCKSEFSNDFEDKGVHGFSDSQILASENDQNYMKNERRRAISDVRRPQLDLDFQDQTWYGQEAKQAQCNLKKFRSVSVACNSYKPTPKGFLTKLRRKIKKSRDEKDFDVEKLDYIDKTKKGRFSVFNLPGDRLSKPKEQSRKFSMQGYLQSTNKGRASLFSIPDNDLTKTCNRSRKLSEYHDPLQLPLSSLFDDEEQSYLQRTRAGRASVMSTEEQAAVLENTTIADLIRAYASIAVPEILDPDPPAARRPNVNATRQPAKARRLPIRPVFQTRRASLIPSSPTTAFRARRLSLSPVVEHNLLPPPYSRFDSTSSARSSLRSHSGPFSITSAQNKNVQLKNLPDIQVTHPEDTNSDKSV